MQTEIMFLDKEGFGFFAKQLSLTKNCQIQETANTKKINSPNDFKYGNKFNDFCIRVIHIQNFKKVIQVFGSCCYLHFNMNLLYRNKRTTVQRDILYSTCIY